MIAVSYFCGEEPVADVKLDTIVLFSIRTKCIDDQKAKLAAEAMCIWNRIVVMLEDAIEVVIQETPTS